VPVCRIGSDTTVHSIVIMKQDSLWTKSGDSRIIFAKMGEGIIVIHFLFFFVKLKLISNSIMRYINRH